MLTLNTNEQKRIHDPRPPQPALAQRPGLPGAACRRRVYCRQRRLGANEGQQLGGVEAGDSASYVPEEAPAPILHRDAETGADAAGSAGAPPERHHHRRSLHHCFQNPYNFEEGPQDREGV